MYKILIVDDDKVSRYILKRYSKWDNYGFSIEGEAVDGKDALEKIGITKFDLIISDIKMPGMNGIEFLGELKNNNYDICVILLSTYSDFQYAKQGIRLGAFDYIIKPVNNELLDEALERAEIYLNKKKKEEEKKQFAESLISCYPKSSVKKLILQMVSPNLDITCEAEKIFNEIINILEKNISKTGMMLSNLLLKLQDDIYNVWPWLKKIEGSIIDDQLFNVESLDAMKELFLKSIDKMIQSIRKYELHQTDSLVKNTCEYVLSHVEENVTLEKIAEEMHANRDYIGKLFKQVTGYNFKQYVTKVKMEHAKYLMKIDYYKNYEISEKLGYSNVDYFCRLFKNYTGYTPIEFRKNCFNKIYL